MRKRLRKKKHLGEFAVRGVSLRVRFDDGFDDAGFESFIDDFIDWIEAKGLQFGGGGSHQSGFEGTIDPSPQSREILPSTLLDLEAWLGAREQVCGFEISPPWDLWHGRDPFDGEVVQDS
jgi:uncharacterized protein YggL (DUF469 family)